MTFSGVGTAHVPPERSASRAAPAQGQNMSTNTQQDIETAAFQEASFIIDESATAEKVRRWLDEDGQHPELSDIDIHNVLSGWLGAGLAGLALTEDNVVRMLRTSRVKYVATAEDVREMTQQVLGAMDSRPMPSLDEPLTKSMWEGIRMDRENGGFRLANKRQRFIEFSNAILRAQLDISDAVDDSMSLSLSSLFREAGVEGVPMNQYRQMPESTLMSAEPDAGFSTSGEYGWGYQLATLVSTDLLRTDSVPNIVVGITGHHPRAAAGAAARLADELLENEHSIERVSGGLEYFPDSDPYSAQWALRIHNTKLVMEYTEEQEGVVLASTSDAILVEGTWYRDDMPTELRTAMKDFREASKANRTEDGSRVLSADTQRRLEERRDELVEARRAYEVAAPSEQPSEFEQAFAYGSTDWLRALSEGRYASTRFEKLFRENESTLVARLPWLRGETAHAFVTTLIVAATNAQRIVQWARYHSLDEGNGLMADEWYAMYHLLLPRIQDGMKQWSDEMQPHAVSYWNIDNVEDTDGWRPDGAATVIEFTRATNDVADTVAAALLASLRAQAQYFLEDEDGSENLSREARIELALDFVDANRHGGDDDDVWLPVPAGGALLAAEATLVWGEV